MVTGLADVKPGAWAVVNTGARPSPLITAAEYLSTLAAGHPRYSKWDHAVMCTGVKPDGTVMIAEAEPGGARNVPWHYETRPHLWSTGIIDMPEEAGAAALRYTQAGSWGPRGVPYSGLDYVALTAHSLHVPAPGLRTFIASTMHQICSQLVDQAALDVGEHLFADGRWAGYVKPSDLGFLLASP